MSDRHDLTAESLEDLDVEDVLGVYMLYEDEASGPAYVGRASNLRSRLLEHVGAYDRFWADYMPNVTEAYKKQVDLYHFHGGSQKLDNERHPQRPHKNVKCYHCDVHG